jgi:hypothetical protein
MVDPSKLRNPLDVADRAITRTTLLLVWNVILTIAVAFDLLIGR